MLDLLIYRNKRNNSEFAMQNSRFANMKPQLSLSKKQSAPINANTVPEKVPNTILPNQPIANTSCPLELARDDTDSQGDTGLTKYLRVIVPAKKQPKARQSRQSGISRLSAELYCAQSSRQPSTPLHLDQQTTNVPHGKNELCGVEHFEFKENDCNLEEKGQGDRGKRKEKKQNIIIEPMYIHETIYHEIFPLGSRSYGAISENYYCIILNNSEMIHVNRNCLPSSCLIFASIEAADNIIFMQSINICAGQVNYQQHVSTAKLALPKAGQPFLHINLVEYDSRQKKIRSCHNLCVQYRKDRLKKQPVAEESSQKKNNSESIKIKSIDSNTSLKAHSERRRYEMQEGKHGPQHTGFIKKISMVSSKSLSINPPSSEAQVRNKGCNQISTPRVERLTIVMEISQKQVEELKSTGSGKTTANNSIQICLIDVGDRGKTIPSASQPGTQAEYQFVEFSGYSQHLHEDETVIRKNWLRLEGGQVFYFTNKAVYQIIATTPTRQFPESRTKDYSDRIGVQEEIKCRSQRWLQKIMEYEGEQICNALHLKASNKSQLYQDTAIPNIIEGGGNQIERIEIGPPLPKLNASNSDDALKKNSEPMAMQLVDCCWSTLSSCLVLTSNNLTYEIVDGKVVDCIDFLALVKGNESQKGALLTSYSREMKKIVEIVSTNECSGETSFILVRVQTIFDLTLRKQDRIFQTNSKEAPSPGVKDGQQQYECNVENQIYVFKYNKRWVEFHSKLQNFVNEQVMTMGLPIDLPKVGSNFTPEGGERLKYGINLQSMSIRILSNRQVVNFEMTSSKKQLNQKHENFIYFQWGIIYSEEAHATKNVYKKAKIPYQASLEIRKRRETCWQNRRIDGLESSWGIPRDLNVFVAEINIFGKYINNTEQLNPLCVRLEEDFNPNLKSVFQIRYKCLRNYHGSSEFELTNPLNFSTTDISPYYSFSSNMFNLAILSQRGNCRQLTLHQQNTKTDSKHQQLPQVGLPVKLFTERLVHEFPFTVCPTSICIDNLGLYLVVSTDSDVRLYYILKDRISRGPELKLGGIMFVAYDRYNWHLYAHNGSIFYIIDPWKFEVERQLNFEGQIIRTQVGNQYVFVMWKARLNETVFLTVFPLYQTISQDFKTYETELDIFVGKKQLMDYLQACELLNNEDGVPSGQIGQPAKQKKQGISSHAHQADKQRNSENVELKFCFDACSETKQLFILNQYYIEIHDMNFTSVSESASIANNGPNVLNQHNGFGTYSKRLNETGGIEINQTKSRYANNERPKITIKARSALSAFSSSSQLPNEDFTHFASNIDSINQIEKAPLKKTASLSLSLPEFQAIDPVRRLRLSFKLLSQPCQQKEVISIKSQEWPTCLKFQPNACVIFVGTNLGKILAFSSLEKYYANECTNAASPFYCERVSNSKIQQLMFRRSRYSLLLYVYTGNESIINLRVIDTNLQKHHQGTGFLTQNGANDPRLERKQVLNQLEQQIEGRRSMATREKILSNHSNQLREYSRDHYTQGMILNEFKLYTAEHLSILTQQAQELELVLLKLKGDKEELIIKSKQKLEKELKAMEQKLHRLRLFCRAEEGKLLIQHKNSLDHLQAFYSEDRQHSQQFRVRQMMEGYEAEISELYKKNDQLKISFSRSVKQNQIEIKKLANELQSEEIQVKKMQSRHLQMMQANIDEIKNGLDRNKKIHEIEMKETEHQYELLKSKLTQKMVEAHLSQIKNEQQNLYFAWNINGNISKTKEKLTEFQHFSGKFSDQINRWRQKMGLKIKFYEQCKFKIAQTFAQYGLSFNTSQLESGPIQEKGDKTYFGKYRGALTIQYLHLQIQEKKRECNQIAKLMREVEKRSQLMSSYIQEEEAEKYHRSNLIRDRQKYLAQLKKTKQSKSNRIILSRKRLEYLSKKLFQFAGEHFNSGLNAVKQNKTNVKQCQKKQVYFSRPGITQVPLRFQKQIPGNDKNPQSECKIMEEKKQNLLQSQLELIDLAKLMELISSRSKPEKLCNNYVRKQQNFKNGLENQQAFHQNSELIYDVNKLRIASHFLEQRLKQVKQLYEKQYQNFTTVSNPALPFPQLLKKQRNKSSSVITSSNSSIFEKINRRRNHSQFFSTLQKHSKEPKSEYFKSEHSPKKAKSLNRQQSSSSIKQKPNIEKKIKNEIKKQFQLIKERKYLSLIKRKQNKQIQKEQIQNQNQQISPSNLMINDKTTQFGKKNGVEKGLNLMTHLAEGKNLQSSKEMSKGIKKKLIIMYK